MKRFLFFVIFVLVLSQTSNAQPPNRPFMNGQRIKALKIAFITQTLNLTPEEAQKFWPVYNQYEEEVKKARQANTDDQLKKEEAVLNVKKKFKPEFKKVLSDDKRVDQVFKVDAQFVEEVKKELKRRQEERQQKKAPTTE